MKSRSRDLISKRSSQRLPKLTERPALSDSFELAAAGCKGYGAIYGTDSDSDIDDEEVHAHIAAAKELGTFKRIVQTDEYKPYSIRGGDYRAGGVGRVTGLSTSTEPAPGNFSTAQFLEKWHQTDRQEPYINNPAP